MDVIELARSLVCLALRATGPSFRSRSVQSVICEGEGDGHEMKDRTHCTDYTESRIQRCIHTNGEEASKCGDGSQNLRGGQRLDLFSA